MFVEVRASNIDLRQALRSYVERRLRFVLGRFGDRVGRVVVRIAGLSGPQGGVEKSCRLSVQVLPFGGVTVEEIDKVLYQAIDRATGRIGRLVARELDRARDLGTARELRVVA